MASYNRVILIGNLTRDIELRYLQNQMAVADIGLAVNDKRKNANGEWVEEVSFIDVTVWGRTAEVMSEYLSKGSPVFIEGRLKMDTWDDKQTGQKRSKLKVVCERMQLIGAKGQGGQAGQAGGGPRPAARQAAPSNDAYSQAAPSEEVYDAPPAEASGGDDIPF
jgi:single-strand DNA-binding protein